MNDLNLLVSHALTAVRDAQQSVREGDVAAGDDMQPLLADFAEVMQGLIALGQSAPQTEDAFETAKTALLQNLAQTEDELDVFGADLVSTQEAENDDSAVDMQDDAEADDALIPSPLAAAFAPLQETIASMLLSPVSPAMAASAAGDTGADAALHGAQTGAASLAPNTQAQQAIAAKDAQTAQDAQAANDARDGTAQAANHAAQSSNSAFASAQNGQSAQAGEGAQQGGTLLALAQARDGAPVQAEAADTANMQATGDVSPQPRGLSNQQDFAARVAQADSARIQGQPQPLEQTAANPSETQGPQGQISAQLAQAVSAQPSQEAIAAAKTSAEGTANTQHGAETDTTDAADAAIAAAATNQAPETPRHGAAHQGDNEARDGEKAREQQGIEATRPKSTVAERQAARHMQNYQQAANEQAASGASSTGDVGATNPHAPAHALAPSMTTAVSTSQFVPAAAVPTTPTADAPPVVHLPAVSLPDLPADLSNALAAGAKRVRIEINPPALGSVEVGVQMRDGAVFVSMQAENANVAQHIERHVEDLRAHLKEAGLSLGGFETSARGDEAQQHAQHSGNPSQERLWSDDMLQLAVGSDAVALDELAQPPSLSQQRPGSINVIA